MKKSKKKEEVEKQEEKEEDGDEETSLLVSYKPPGSLSLKPNCHSGQIITKQAQFELLVREQEESVKELHRYDCFTAFKLTNELTRKLNAFDLMRHWSAANYNCRKINK